MPTKRLNWTGRRRITRDRVDIAISREAGRPAFSARITLADLGLAPDARVVVEAYRQAAYMRFAYGTVAFITPPHSTWLEEFDPPEGVLFRVKVIGVGADDGRILAEADQIRPVDPTADESGRKSLLTVRGEALGDEVWQLRVDEGSQPPELVVNSELGIHWKTLARDPHLFWLVYPSALREILRAIVRGGVPETDDLADWRVQWLRFAERQPGVGPRPEEADPEAQLEWIEGVVRSFCRANRLREKYQRLFADEGGAP